MKQNKKWLLLSLLLAVLMIAAGCGSKEETSTKEDSAGQAEKAEAAEKEQEEEEPEEEPEVATSVEEMLKERPGKYSGNLFNEAIIHKALNEKSLQEKDSFQVYNTLLGLMQEGKNYREYYKFLEDFDPSIEAVLSDMPGGMKIDSNGDVGMTANIAILLDASGSMAQKIGGKTKMELAKEAIDQFVSSMPEEANVMLRVYGHKGSNNDSDKKLSCGSTEVVYEMSPYNKGNFKDSLGKFQPKGWTPIAKAITETKSDFEKAEEGQNIIYIVSDGIETCEGDPVKAAKELHDSNIQAMVNIIGFDVDSSGQQQLMSVAQAGGGQYETVQSAEDFNRLWKEERQRLWNEWWNWGNQNWSKVWTEQNNKLNDLINQKNEFSNMTYEEKTRLVNASYYLKDKEQISPETRSEVESLIQQRHDILQDYIDERYEELKTTLETEGDALKESIKKKAEEMKEKYKN